MGRIEAFPARIGFHDDPEMSARFVFGEQLATQRRSLRTPEGVVEAAARVEPSSAPDSLLTGK